MSLTANEIVVGLICESAAWLDRKAAEMPPGALRTCLAFLAAVLLAYAPPMITAVLALVVIIWIMPRGYQDRGEAFALSAEVEQLRQQAQTMARVVAMLQQELEAARATPQRIEGAGHPLYRKVGLDQDCPQFVAVAVRRAYRAKLHPDAHPDSRKAEAERQFKIAEQAFDEIWRLRGFS